MEIARYDIYIVKKYGSKVKVKKNMKFTVWAIALEPDVMEASV